jgi:hypothetical protein
MKVLKILTLAILVILIVIDAWLFAYRYEKRELVSVSALKWADGFTPKNFIEISDKTTGSLIIASTYGAIELPEHSPFRIWAKEILNDSNIEKFDVKIENQYYRVTIATSNEYCPILEEVTLVLSSVTIVTWVSFISLLAIEKKCHLKID